MEIQKCVKDGVRKNTIPDRISVDSGNPFKVSQLSLRKWDECYKELLTEDKNQFIKRDMEDEESHSSQL